MAALDLSIPTVIGSWDVRHRRLKERLSGCIEWAEFAGTTVAQKVLGGFENMDDNTLELPGGPYRAVTLRSFDPSKAMGDLVG